MLPENYQTLALDEKRTVMLEQLKHDCVVTFIKVDGSLREMPCTLRPEALPAQAIKEGAAERKPNPNTISVWCLDKREWRSFKLDNVVSVKPLDSVAP